jgi:hypothetical protein
MLKALAGWANFCKSTLPKPNGWRKHLNICLFEPPPNAVLPSTQRSYAYIVYLANPFTAF